MDGTSAPKASPPTTARPTTIDDDPLTRLRWACAAPLPHPDPAVLRQCTEDVVGWVLRHHLTLPDQPIGHPASRETMEHLLREPPPEEGRDFSSVLARFEEEVAPNCFRVNHPRFLAFVPSAPTYFSVLGDVLCAGTNFFAGVWMEAAGAAEIELIVLDWFKEFLGYPTEAAGILTSGGSEANLTALLVARDTLTPEERRRAVLYVTEQRHWSIDRAARIIGLLPEQIRPVPTDGEFALCPEALLDLVGRDRAAGLHPWVLVANAGATNTGTVDPLVPLADLCVREKLWFHVDAAYGWSAVLTPEGRRTLAGLERADSLVLDPHKWFGQTFEAGCVLIREGRRLAESFTLRPDYLQDVEPAEDEVNFADRGIALTRRFKALKIWLSVQTLGVGWFRDFVEHSCRLAEFAEALLEHAPVFEILSPRRLSIVCFRYAPSHGTACPRDLDRLNLALAEGLRQTGRAFLSSTRLRGVVALRFCFVNWRTTADDVEEVVRLLTEIGARLTLSETPP